MSSLNLTQVVQEPILEWPHVERYVRLLTLGAHTQRGLQYSVCLSTSVCESVTSLTAAPLTHRYKGRYESKANAVLKVFDSRISLKNTLFKSYGVICSPQRTLTVSTVSRYIRRLETIGRLAAFSNTVTYDA